MAKRKRLTPAQPGYLGVEAGQRAPETKSMGPVLGPPPIAQVAGAAATQAALDEVAGALQAARSQGRMIEVLPLAAVDETYLVRDRMVQDEDEMAALMDSLRARGQQTPIEVTALPAPSGALTHGLISGWRRLTALRRLHAEDRDPQFATVRALVVTPETAQQAYVAMVEENEIRVNLSLYERAGIALRAAREGIYPTPRHAVLGLFGSTTRAKRSKIGSFVALVEALDDVLRYPTAIPEKLGLGLVRALQEQDGFAEKLRNRLEKTAPAAAEAELAVLAAALAPAAPSRSAGPAPAPASPSSAPSPLPAPETRTPDLSRDPAPGLHLQFNRNATPVPRIELSGPRADEALFRALHRWLAATGGREE